LVLGIEPQYREWHGTYDEAEALVVSLNVCKRHLNPSQAAMVGTRIATLRQGRQERESNVEISTFRTTQAQAAEKLNVSREQIIKARKVTETAAPEVIEEVERGKMSLHKAGKLAAAVPDKAEQAEIIKAGRVDEVLKKALPPEEPAPLPKTNTLHTPATRQQIDRGPEPAPPRPVDPFADLEDGAWYVYYHNNGSPTLTAVTGGDIQRAAAELNTTEPDILEVVVAQHTTPQVLAALTAGYEGEQAKRVARQLREAADRLDPQPVIHDMTEKPAAKSKKHPTADQLMEATRDYPAKWTSQLITQVHAWAEYKQSLSGNAKVRSLTSWAAMLARIDNVQKMRGPGTVCEMINKAIANGWQGWEHDSGNGKSTIASTRIDTGEDYSDLTYRTV
jgi:hypothetical protein